VLAPVLLANVAVVNFLYVRSAMAASIGVSNRGAGVHVFRFVFIF